MTTKTNEQLRIYYEIAKSIGKSDDIIEMFKKSIPAYLKWLDCSACSIIRLKDLKNGQFITINQFAIPYTFELIEEYRDTLKDIAPKYSKKELSEFLHKLPLKTTTSQGTTIYILDLPDYGFMMLQKKGEEFNEDIQNIIHELNQKLAGSANSCFRNQALEENEFKYKTLVEQLPELICETDLEGNLTYVNQYAMLKIGFTDDDFKKGMSVFEMFSEEELPRAKKNFQKTTTYEEIGAREYSIVKRNGETFPGVIYTSRIIENHEIIGIRGVLIDISESKESEKKLKEYTERLEMALLGSGSGLWDWNLKTNEFYISDQFYAIVGYAPSEIKTCFKSWLEIVNEEDRPAIDLALTNHLTGKSTYFICEHRIKTKDNTWKWILNTGKAVDFSETGAPLRIVGTALDINKQKENEETLKKNLQQQEILSKIAVMLNSTTDFKEKINNVSRIIGEHLHASDVYIFEDSTDGKTCSNNSEWHNPDVEKQNKCIQNISYEDIPSFKEILLKNDILVSEDINLLPLDIQKILKEKKIQSLVIFPLNIYGNYAGFIGFDECQYKRIWAHFELELLRSVAAIISNSFARHRVGYALRKSEEKFRNFVENANDIMIAFTSKAIVTYITPNSFKLSGFDPDQFFEKPISDKLHPDDCSYFQNKLNEYILEGPKDEKIEFRLIHSNESWVWCQIRISLLYDESGDPYFFGIIRDITNQKNAEEQILKLSKGIEQSPAMVVITDVYGVLEYVNPKFTEITGYTLNEIVGKTPAIFNSGKQDSSFFKNLWDTIKSGNVWQGELINKKKNGELYWEFQSISPINNSKNQITNFLSIKEDISERKKLTEELINAKEVADIANKAKGDFLATMSHEIRTPMNGVIGTTSLLLRTPLTDEQQDYVNTIRNSGDSLLTIINDILDYSKIESGKMQLEKQPFDLRLCIDEVLDLFTVAANQKGLQLLSFVDPNIHTQFLGDTTRFRQILVNLVGNALKFTATGFVKIETILLDTTKDQNKYNLRFIVSDTGIGIPEGKINQLFKPFTQVDTSTNRKFGGTGLGLAITVRLVELMEGYITVSSKENTGSEFLFEIKLDQSDIPDIFSQEKRLPESKVYFNFEDVNLTKTLENYCNLLHIQITSKPGNSDYILYPSKSFQTRSPVICIANSKKEFISLGETSIPVKANSFITLIKKVTTTIPVDIITPPDEMLLASVYPITILVAEDNSVNQKIMDKSLKYYGYAPDFAANGLEVLDALKRQEYNLIFMDIQMPEMDGLETTQKILELYPHNRPLIIAMTASAMLEDRQMCFDAGMDDYISKPLKVEQIGELVKKWGEKIADKNIEQ